MWQSTCNNLNSLDRHVEPVLNEVTGLAMTE